MPLKMRNHILKQCPSFEFTRTYRPNAMYNNKHPNTKGQSNICAILPLFVLNTYELLSKQKSEHAQIGM